MNEIPPYYVRKSRTIMLWELTDGRTGTVVEVEGKERTYHHLLVERDKLNAAWRKEQSLNQT